MHDFVQDVRYGLRMMARAPVVMLVAAVSLGAGIAANTVTFSVANGFFFEPFPYRDQDSLALVFENHRKDGDDQLVSPANFLDWRERSQVFEELAAYTVRPMNLTGGDVPLRVSAVVSSPQTLQTLGREPFLGRSFRAEDAAGGVAVLSHSFWLEQYEGRRDVLGLAVVLDGEPHVVIGVMPEDFDFVPANVDLFVPSDFRESQETRSERSLFVMGRLSEGRTLAEGQAELDGIASALETEYPEANAGFGARVIKLRELFPGPTDTTLMYILLTVAGFVLVIACANVANLLLARAEDRQREVAVRSALGAGRARIVRQLLTESVLLAALGGVLGTALSFYGVRWVAGSMPAELPRAFMPELDLAVLSYTVGVSIAAGLLFGVAPALHAFGDDPREALSENTRGGTASRKRNRLRSSFVVAELAAALALLVGGGVLMKVFQETVSRGPGFEADDVLTTVITASEDRYPDEASLTRFYEEILTRVAALPRVRGVAAMIDLPRSRQATTTPFVLDGREPPRANEEPTAVWQAVNPDYFETLGVTLRSGRRLRATDRVGTEPVVVVNETFVDSYLPDEEPLGQRVTVLGASRRIVGVSADVFQTRMPREGGAMAPMLYLPLAQKPARSFSLALRVAGEPEDLAPDLRAAIWAVDPDQPVGTVQTMLQHVEAELSGPKIISVVLGLFGAVALTLSAIGIYGVMAQSVVQRRREIGIRMALGAGRDDVLKLVTRQGMKLAALGVVVGAPIAFALVRAIRSMLFSSEATEPALIAAITAGLLGVALVASMLPAIRASRLHPVRALQSD